MTAMTLTMINDDMTWVCITQLYNTIKIAVQSLYYTLYLLHLSTNENELVTLNKRNLDLFANQLLNLQFCSTPAETNNVK